METTLRKDDVTKIAEELLPVQSKAMTLGRILKVSTDHLVHKQYTHPLECLIGVLDGFVKQVKPRPTWKVVLGALRSPLMGELGLAQEIENSLSPSQNGMGKKYY